MTAQYFCQCAPEASPSSRRLEAFLVPEAPEKAHAAPCRQCCSRGLGFEPGSETEVEDGCGSADRVSDARAYFRPLAFCQAWFGLLERSRWMDRSEATRQSLDWPALV